MAVSRQELLRYKMFQKNSLITPILQNADTKPFRECKPFIYPLFMVLEEECSSHPNFYKLVKEQESMQMK